LSISNRNWEQKDDSGQWRRQVSASLAIRGGRVCKPSGGERLGGIRAYRLFEVFRSGVQGCAAWVTFALCEKCAPQGEILPAKVTRKCADRRGLVRDRQAVSGIRHGIVELFHLQLDSGSPHKKN